MIGRQALVQRWSHHNVPAARPFALSDCGARAIIRAPKGRETL
jgi:hypothetical protein